MVSSQRKKAGLRIPGRVKTLSRVPINFEETDWEGYIGARSVYEKLEDRVRNVDRNISLRI